MLKRIWKVIKGMAKANVICILLECDWEEVARITEDFAINNLLEERFRKYAKEEQNKRTSVFGGTVPPDRLDRDLTQNVCLRCCAVQDNIQEYLANCRANYRATRDRELERRHQKILRQKQAEIMLENCAKDKFRKVFK